MEKKSEKDREVKEEKDKAPKISYPLSAEVISYYGLQEKVFKSGKKKSRSMPGNIFVSKRSTLSKTTQEIYSTSFVFSVGVYLHWKYNQLQFSPKRCKTEAPTGNRGAR